MLGISPVSGAPIELFHILKEDKKRETVLLGKKPECLSGRVRDLVCWSLSFSLHLNGEVSEGSATGRWSLQLIKSIIRPAAA